MLFPSFRCTTWNSHSGVHSLISAKSEFFQIRIFFIWIWSFLYQALADRVGKDWGWKALLVEEYMLVGSDVLGFQQDIGSQQCAPLLQALWNTL